MMRFFALVLMLAAASAMASVPQKLALPLGHTTTVTMPSQVSKVTVQDPSKVQIMAYTRSASTSRPTSTRCRIEVESAVLFVEVKQSRSENIPPTPYASVR
jgi:hypothetical protein